MATKASVARKEAAEREAREQEIASLKKWLSELESQVKELVHLVSKESDPGRFSPSGDEAAKGKAKKNS